MTLSLALVLSVLRIMQMAWHWPHGLPLVGSDLGQVLLQGARFDLKVCAAAGVVLWLALAALGERVQGKLLGVLAFVYVLLALINLHYFGFYKTPIDAVIFGLFEDDTKAIFQTIWSDFPVVLTLAVLGLMSWLAIALRRVVYNTLHARLSSRNTSGWSGVVLTLVVTLVAVFMLVLITKGTLRAMALGRQNLSVTTSQFLNDMVPNGVIALNFAWDSRKDSQNLSDPLVGLRNYGYRSPMDAARALGLQASDLTDLRNQLFAHGGDAPKAAAASPKKNLFFFLMESWSAEPFLYQSKDFDVLGRMAPTLKDACHFSNFDSAQPGTHPSLEAILYSSPITPLTLGPQGKKPIPWALARVLQKAGYRTLFVTSARAGWRDLDRILKVQGFDEVVDANNLGQAYPDATLGIWGVWDGYVFKYLKERLKQPPGDKPLFVFVLTSTNHPPYDLPADYKRVPRNQDQWGGERNADTLWLNIDSYHYATDLLGGFVQDVQKSPWGNSSYIAATGDHNVRSFGIYATPDRRYLMTQVPFVIWGNAGHCGTQLTQPASHLDMFPTLLPLLGVNDGYVKTGRNLLAPSVSTESALNTPLSVNYMGSARDAQGAWVLGNPKSYVCTPVPAAGVKTPSGPACTFNADDDAQARARIGLLDWNVRVGLR